MQTWSGLERWAAVAPQPRWGGSGGGLRSQTKAEDIIWFQIDANTHQSVIIFSSEEDAKSELEMRRKQREQSINETGHKMVEETMGPVLSIMSEV